RLALTRARERKLAKGARLISLAVPPTVEPAGALLLWSALHDLLRPRLTRLLGGQPQLAWEIAADEGGTRFRLWVPRAVPPGLADLVLPGPPARPALDPTISPDVRSVLEKASHPPYRCLIRLAVSSPDRSAGRGRIHALAGAFAAYEGRIGLRRRRVLAVARKL